MRSRVSVRLATELVLGLAISPSRIVTESVPILTKKFASGWLPRLFCAWQVVQRMGAAPSWPTRSGGTVSLGGVENCLATRDLQAARSKLVMAGEVRPCIKHSHVCAARGDR